MESSKTSNYPPPVNQLLTYGEAHLTPPDKWPNYLELGFGPEHIPDLIRMATDQQLNEADTDSLEVWAPTHAWRALGQLRAEAAIEPLLSLFEELEYDDWVTEELPEIFGMIGPTALPALAAYLSDTTHGESELIDAISCIKHIAKRWPDARSQSIEILMDQLERYKENDYGVNGFLILALVDLQAMEALPLIEQAFAANRVDLMIMGDWNDVQVDLGLKSREEVEQSRSRRLPELPFPSNNQITSSPFSSQTYHEHKVSHKKSKKKMSKQSRKKNRKR